jgi:putative hydrolase of the HAD superfamily
LEAGLNAVFVPHERTWTLEKQAIRIGTGALRIVERFADLRNQF